MNRIRYITAVVICMFFLCGCGDSGKVKVYNSGQDENGVGNSYSQSGEADRAATENQESGNIEKNAESMSEHADGSGKDADGSSQCEDGSLSREIYVQICGAVNQPGVYKVTTELRVFEVIELAGGVTESADTDVVNLAKPVYDEMRIYIPVQGEEIQEDVSENYDDIYSDGETIREKDYLIDINNASIEELMTLPGIGEMKAAAIIEYRERIGAFERIEDIMNISGIKQAAFDKIKDKIKV